METSLDTIQKLMAYGHITTGIKYHADPRKSLVDMVIVTACDCFDLNQEDHVQLQIITTLLTAITSCDVHGKILHLAIKTCFNIHLVSKSVINQQTAKAALTQMLNIIFHKMESRQPIMRKDTLSPSGPSSDQLSHHDDDTESVLGDSDDNMSTISDGSIGIKTNGHHVSVGDNGAGEPVDEETLQYISSAVKDMVAAVTEKFEKASRTSLHFDNQFQRDAFNIFRALCRLSMKALPPQYVLQSLPFFFICPISVFEY